MFSKTNAPTCMEHDPTLEILGSSSYSSAFAHLTSTKKKHLLSFTINVDTY